jgi:hypothetical protein
MVLYDVVLYHSGTIRLNCKSAAKKTVFVLSLRRHLLRLFKKGYSSAIRSAVNAAVSADRREIRLLEGIAKCRHLQKLTYKGTLRQVLICLKPRTTYPPSHTVYVYTVYTYAIKEGGEPERTLEGQQLTKLGRKYKHD